MTADSCDEAGVHGIDNVVDNIDNNGAIEVSFVTGKRFFPPAASAVAEWRILVLRVMAPIHKST